MFSLSHIQNKCILQNTSLNKIILLMILCFGQQFFIAQNKSAMLAQAKILYHTSMSESLVNSKFINSNQLGASSKTINFFLTAARRLNHSSARNDNNESLLTKLVRSNLKLSFKISKTLQLNISYL